MPDARVRLRYVTGPGSYLPDGTAGDLSGRQFETDADGFFEARRMTPGAAFTGQVEHEAGNYALEQLDPEAFTETPTGNTPPGQAGRTRMRATALGRCPAG